MLNTWQGRVGHAAGLLLRSLREKAHQWWYFLDHRSLPPDNNLAERSLRLAVTKRKVSGGSRSMSRFEQTADLLSVIQTCRFQGKSAMTFFRDAISAHSCELFMLSLIPQSKTCILTSQQPDYDEIPEVAPIDELQTFVGNKKTRLGCGQP